MNLPAYRECVHCGHRLDWTHNRGKHNYLTCKQCGNNYRVTDGYMVLLYDTVPKGK